MGSALAQAQTKHDLLVNHNVGMSFYGVEGDGNQANGPAGAEFFYLAKVKINGAAGQSVNDVTLTQILPEGALFQGIDTPEGTNCSPSLTLNEAITSANQTIECAIPSINSDAFTELKFRVILPTVSTGWLAIASATAANNTDPELGNSADLRRNISTFEAADLAVAFTGPAANATVTQGEAFNYELQVTNKAQPYGKELKAGEWVTVRFEQPDGVQFGNTPTGTGWTCTALTASTPIWECAYQVTNTISTNSNLPTLSVPATAQSLGTIAAVASVSHANAGKEAVRDVAPSDNTADISLQVQADTFTNVTLAKSVQPAVLDQQGGDQKVTYTITPRWASGTNNPGTVTVTDPMPEGVSLVPADVIAANGAPWNCAATTATELSCTFDASSNQYPSRGNAFPALRVPALVAGSAAQSVNPIINTAKVSATAEHPDRTGDNTATATVSTSNQAKLSLEKSPVGVNGVIKNGTTYAYRIRIRNQGPVALLAGHTITVDDQLNGNLRFIAATDTSASSTPASAAWSCTEGTEVEPTSAAVAPRAVSAAGALISCTYTAKDDLAVGKDIDMYLWVEVVGLAENETASLSNSAQISGVTGRDPLPAGTGIGNSADVKVSDKSADLAISKQVAFNKDAQSGDLVTYTLTVTNTGDNNNQPAKTVQVADNITNLITAAYANAPFNIEPILEDTNAAAGSYWYNEYLTVRIAGTANTSDSCSLNGYNSSQTEAALACTFHDMPVNSRYTITVQAKQFVDPYTGANPHEPTGITANGQDGVVSNVATVSSPDTNDSNPNNNTSETVYVPMKALTDLALTRQASPLNRAGEAQAAAGGAITYLLTVENKGPSAASEVVMEDSLPLGAYWVGVPAAASNNGQCGYRVAGSDTLQAYQDGDLITEENQTLVCEWAGNFAKGQQTVRYQLRSEETGQDQLNSAASVRTSTAEADYNNNDADQSILLSEPQVDVLVEMSHTADGIALGTPTTYTITVTNNGASDSYARDVVMHNQFHSALNTTGRAPVDTSAVFEFGEITAINSRNRDAGAAAFTADNCSVDKTEGAGFLACEFPWMAPGESVDIVFTMTAASLPEGKAVGTIFHNATVAAALEQHQDFDVSQNNSTQDRTSTYDPAKVDPSNPDDPTIPVLADLELNKSVLSISHENPDATADDPVTAGSTVEYQLVVRNLETDAALIASQVVVTDTLPAGVSLVDGSLPAGCSYAADNRILSCAIGSLGAAQERSFSFSVRLDTPFNETDPNLVNCAAVSSDFDPVDGNNESCVETPAKRTVPPTPVAVPSLQATAVVLLALCMLAMAWRTRRRGA